MSESEAGSSTPAETEDNSLITGLPEHVSLCCIARVPRKYHAWLNCVSKKWRDLVRSEEWLEYRKEHGLQETWIYVFIMRCSLEVFMLDPSAASMRWKPIRFHLDDTVIPEELEALGKRIYIVGGIDRVLLGATDQVNCYDASTYIVSIAPSLPRPRHSHICVVLNGKIYVIGGFSEATHIGPLPSDVYDPVTNSWTCLSDNNSFDFVFQSVVMDGKIYVRGRGATLRAHVAAYDPSSNMWELEDGDFTTGWNFPSVNVDGSVYTFDTGDGECSKWDREERKWMVVGKLPDVLLSPRFLVAIGKTVYAISSNLSTLIIHLDEATGNPESILPYNFIGSVYDDALTLGIGCTCVAI